ncbi:MAG: hypothetical protein M3460_30195 [Actinomycetota bacterium]|nr:hypothetical protein [Actinomycetota bacterium]
MASDERAQRRADSSGVSFISISTSAGAGVVVLETVINDDFVHRFQACSAASDAIWHDGWLACRTDEERGAWIEHYADYLEDRLDG